MTGDVEIVKETYRKQRNLLGLTAKKSFDPDFTGSRNILYFSLIRL